LKLGRIVSFLITETTNSMKNSTHLLFRFLIAIISACTSEPKENSRFESKLIDFENVVATDFVILSRGLLSEGE
tara:strand:- start:1025 stop:1246 length:222 start_codon:yes stop_codon:yes gene_type:complete